MNVLNNGNQGKIRQAIQKFRMNRKIIDIQRNFLKRLLMSKAGMVVISVKKWQSLPERADGRNGEKGNKFVQGLKRYIDRTLTKAFNPFKY